MVFIAETDTHKRVTVAIDSFQLFLWLMIITTNSLTVNQLDHKTIQPRQHSAGVIGEAW